MNYTFNCIQAEETDYLYSEIYNLMILIQDNYSQSINLSKYSNINCIQEISKNIENDNNFVLYCKFYDFFNKIFEQASNSNNQYILPQLLIVEQFISFRFVPKINIFLESENFIDKIIYIFNFFRPLDVIIKISLIVSFVSKIRNNINNNLLSANIMDKPITNINIIIKPVIKTFNIEENTLFLSSSL